MDDSARPSRAVSGRVARPFRSRRKGSGPSTGLRAVTMLVVELLRQEAVLSYESIANQVCQHLKTSDDPSEARNIRRRAYDVINVMQAVGFIQKRKKRLFSVQSLVDESGVLQPDLLLREREERLHRIACKEARNQAVLESCRRRAEHQARRQSTPPDADTFTVSDVVVKQEPQQTEQPEQEVTFADVFGEVLHDDEPSCRPQANVVVQQIEYLYAPFEVLPASAFSDPNLQDAASGIAPSAARLPLEADYSRDPVEAILSAFY